MNKRLSKVKEIKETKDWKEVNTLVNQGWILLCIYPIKEDIMYSIGRVED